MDYNRAIQILNLDPNFSLNELKKNYHIEALKTHPDKTGANNTHEFNEVNDAYNFLLKINTNNMHEFNDTPISYAVLLEMFISKFTDNNKIRLLDIIELISSKSELFINKFFNNLTKEKAIRYYNFILKYNDIFSLKTEIVDDIRDIIIKKELNESGNIIILNPKLDDLFNNNIYRLIYNSIEIPVPLWHRENIYDISKNIDIDNEELIVKCIPELPDHITIDDNNNLYIDISINSIDIFNKPDIIFNLGKNIFKIHIETLFIKKYQKVILKKQGISLKKEDIYDINDKADITVYLEII